MKTEFALLLQYGQPTMTLEQVADLMRLKPRSPTMEGTEVKLPEPDGSATRDRGQAPGYEHLGGRLEEEVDAWSEPLVRAYGAECARQAVLQERERCAKVVEDAEWLAGAVCHDIARTIRSGA